MRNFFRFVFRILVVAMVFLVSALTAMRLAIHGREVVVPKVAGMSITEAERVGARNGLLIEVEDRFYSGDVPENRILSQLPQQGEKVRRGTHIRVALSLGPQKIVIPDLIGQSQRAAEINIARRGLEIGSAAVTSLPGFPPGQIVAQSPPPNAAGVASPKVNILVAAGPDQNTLYLVPDFVGHSIEEAKRAIAGSPMKLGKVIAPKNGTNSAPTSGKSANAGTSSKPAPKIVSIITKQTPAAGQKIPAGTSINFEVNH